MPSLIRTDQHQWQVVSGCCTKVNVQMTEQTPWLMQDSWYSSGNQHWQLPEIVSINGTDYYHMIMGSEADGFIQETYIPLGFKKDFTGSAGRPAASPVTWQWAVNQYQSPCGSDCWHSASGGDQVAVAGGSNGVVKESGNARYPLNAPPGKDSGNGSGNPTRVLIRQKLVSGDITQEFLKDEWTNKPVITQDVRSETQGDVMLSSFRIDMSNSGYNTNSESGLVTNELRFVTSDLVFREAAYYHSSDSPTPSFADLPTARKNVKQEVTGGRYTYTPGSGPGGANGTYLYADGGDFYIEDVDWNSYFDVTEANPWSFTENRPR